MTQDLRLHLEGIKGNRPGEKVLQSLGATPGHGLQPGESSEAPTTRQAYRREYERQLRAEAKAMGMTYLQYREYRRGNMGRKTRDDPTIKKRNRATPGQKVPSVREVHDQLLAQQPFIRELKTIPDTGRTRPRCPSCNRRSDFDDYFCIHCGEHHDELYCYEHAQAPITLTREQIMAEYAAADRPFHAQNYDAGQLKFRTIADLTGINPYARMPVETRKEEDRWKDLKGFSRTTSSDE